MRSALGGLQTKLRYTLIWTSCAEIAAAILCVGLVSFLLDYSLELPRFLRVAGLLLALFGVYRFTRRALKRLARAFTAEDLVPTVEAYNPELEGHLASVFDYSREWQELNETGSDELQKLLVERALRESREAVAQAQIGRALNLFPLLKRAAIAVVLLALGSYGAVQAPRSAAIWFERNVLLSDKAWPRRTHVVLEREDLVWHLPRRDPLEIAAWVTGEIPREITLYLESESGKRSLRLVPGARSALAAAQFQRLWEEVGREGTVPDYLVDVSTPPLASRAVRFFPSVGESFDFWWEAGDHRTPTVKVILHDRPRVESVAFKLQYPEYLERKPETIEDPAAEISVPEGSDVALVVTADLPLSGGWLRHGDGPREDLELVDEKRATYSFRPEETSFIDLAVTDREWELESAPPRRFGILVFPDEPPTIELELIGNTELMTPTGRLGYRIEIADDHGFSRLELEFRRRLSNDTRDDEDLPPESRALLWEALGSAEETDYDDAGRRAVSSGELDLADFELTSDSALLVRALVSDNDGVNGAKTVASQTEVVRIVVPEDLMAEMDRLRALAQARLEALAAREETVATLLSIPAEGERPSDPSDESLAMLEGTRPQRAVAKADEISRPLRTSAQERSQQSQASPQSQSSQSQQSQQSQQSPQSQPRRQSPTGERLSDLSNAQDQATDTAKEIAQALRDMVETLERNELTEPEESEQLRRDVSEPLEAISRQSLPRNAQEMRTLAGEQPNSKIEAQLQRDVEEIARELRALAAKLGGAKSMEDVIGRLEGILELQRDAIEETGRSVERQTGGTDGLRSF
jgi:hypothetical protein